MKAGILIGHLNNKGNEGAIIRTAETFGLSNVFVIGKKEKLYSSAEGCDKHMNFFEFKNTEDFLRYVAGNNHKLVCIENLNKAVDISEVEHYPVNPIFIIGHESNGIPKELLKNASATIKIQQGMGYGSCLNTGIACGIIIHDFFVKHFKIRKECWETSVSGGRK